MGRSTIMIVSADGNQSRVMVDCLKNAGYGAQIASQGKSALEMIRSDRPLLIILDWRLPDLSGLAILRTIRAEAQTAKLPIILMSREMKEEDILIGLEAGADICLAETFHPKVFVARVRSLLRRVALS
jgi:DNA-binding response OmpR family regulator